jgi:glycosyltransferase involved in cell wall biosynthesis
LARLAEAGHPVAVVSGFPGVHRGAAALPARERWHGVWIERVGLRASVKKNLWQRATTYFSYTAAATWRLVRAERGQQVLVVTNPPFLPVFAALASKLRGHHLTVMLQDIYPDGLVAVGRTKAGGLVDRLWRAANRWAFAQAREHWVLGRDMADLVHQRYGVPSSRIRFVPHWSPVPFAQVVSAESTGLHRELGLGGKFVVQYSGNMGLWHDIQTIVRAAELLRARSEIVFLMVGQGRECGPAKALAERLGLTNMRWLPYQPKEALEDSLSCCHAALISQRAGLEGVAVPCKLYGILASGRAVLAQVPATSEVARVVDEEGCGIVVPPGDAVALAAAVQRLADDRTEAQRLGARARAAYLAKYTIDQGVRAFAAGFADA